MFIVHNQAYQIKYKWYANLDNKINPFSILCTYK